MEYNDRIQDYLLKVLEQPFISAKYICSNAGINHDRLQNVKRGLKFTDKEISDLQYQISLLKDRLDRALSLTTERNLMEAIICPFIFPKALIPKVGGNDTNYDRIFRANKGAFLHLNEKTLLILSVKYVHKLITVG